MMEYTPLVRRMQQFLQREVEAGNEADANRLAAFSGYSRRHCERLFRQFTGRSISEYVRLLTLTHAARQLAGTEESVLGTALDFRYESHEGFTRAFRSAFGVSPGEYRKGGRPIPYFIPYPVNPTIPTEGVTDMNDTPVVTATYLERPARKLLYLPSEAASDYFSFCEEKGCEWEGLMASIPARLDAPALLTLPGHLVPAGKASAAAGVELPLDWAGEIPEGYLVTELPAGALLELRSAPYEDEEDYCIAIEQVFKAYENYDPTPYGYRYTVNAAPLLNMGARTEEGARILIPVERTK